MVTGGVTKREELPPRSSMAIPFFQARDFDLYLVCTRFPDCVATLSDYDVDRVSSVACFIGASEALDERIRARYCIPKLPEQDTANEYFWHAALGYDEASAFARSQGHGWRATKVENLSNDVEVYYFSLPKFE